VTSESTTRWPLLEERAPFSHATPTRRRRLPRSAWLLTGLAFLCGGLVSAAVFSIGWRHQAQRDTAARTALASATARIDRLSASLATARQTAARERRLEAQATAAQQALMRAAARVGDRATVSNHAAASVSSGAGSLTASASKIASELKTLETYLTTTPTNQLDPGYIVSQTGYLAQQLTRLQASGGNLGDSIASLEASLRKLARDAGSLKTG
jgi:prefoldin subunit 5